MDVEYFTVAEVAERLKVTPQAVYKWIKSKRLKSVYVGSERRVTGSAIEDFIKASTEEMQARADLDKIQSPSLVAA